MLGAGRAMLRGGLPRVTFDRVNIGSSITISTDGLTATYGGVNTYDLARSTTSKNAGKVYVEAIFTTPGGTLKGLDGVGLFTPSTTLHANGSSSISYKGIAVEPDNGLIKRDGTTLNSGTQLNGGGSFATGSRIGFAFDFANARFYARYNGGQWNASGSANPATNTGGYDFSSLTGPFYFGVIFAASVTDAIALKIASSSWVDAAPSGFAPWL